MTHKGRLLLVVGGRYDASPQSESVGDRKIRPVDQAVTTSHDENKGSSCDPIAKGIADTTCLSDRFDPAHDGRDD